MASPSNDICLNSACGLAALLQSRAVSALEVLDAHLARIEAINPLVNAIVTLDVEGARAQAKVIDQARVRGDALGPCAGLPIAIKDMEPVQGMRSTQGSPIYRDHVPDHDSAMVARLRSEGLVIIGKTNTPEFALGAQTFNTIFGATRNPWDVRRTCGGSSGGAAVSVATRMLPFADGSDLGGSLRNPGGFNHVFGLRTSPGRVADSPNTEAWMGLSVLGPIARSAADAALLLSAMAGWDARDALSFDEDPRRFREPLDRDFRGVRVAFSRDLGGLPIEPAVSAVLEEGASLLRSLGCVVEEDEPDLGAADLAFDMQRALLLAERHAHLLPAHRHEMKDTAVWNIEQAFALTPQKIVAANLARTATFQSMQRFLETYEFLVAPVNQVAPFPIEMPYVGEINGVKLATYFDWIRSCTRISATSHPAASVPCGFTPDGLPVGIQVIGRHRAERSVLQLAHAIEQVNPNTARMPALAQL